MTLAGVATKVTLQSLILLLLYSAHIPGSTEHLSGWAGQWPVTSTKPSPPMLRTRSLASVPNMSYMSVSKCKNSTTHGS